MHQHDEHARLPTGARGAAQPGKTEEVQDLPVSVLAVNVGNTNTRFVTYHAGAAGHLHDGVSLPNTDLVGLARAIADAAEHLHEHDDNAALVIASTNHAFRNELIDALGPTSKLELFVVGRDLELPIRHTLDEAAAAKAGQDRFLNAMGAFDLLKQACVIVDAGTAVTVDFVDGEGVFQGGAIAPGLRMQLRSLHDGTSALPIIEPRKPDEEVFGKNTEQAMLNGAFYGISGMVRRLAERYAEKYEAYPSIIATGGDSLLLFENDDLVERILPDLTLRGIAVACREVLGQE